MLFHCYFDDSKDKTQEVAYVCGGLYGTKDAWKSFSGTWEEKLKEHKLEYFKSSECARLEKQFERFRSIPNPGGRDAANKIRSEFRRIIEEARGIRGTGAVVPMAEFNKVQEHESAGKIFPKKYVYHRAFELDIFKAKLITCMSKRDRIGFVHDDGNDYDELHKIFRSFKKNNPKTAPFLKGFIPWDDKDCPPLQAADLFANSLMGTTMRFIQRPREAKYEGIVKFNRSEISVWTASLGERVLARNLGKRNMPIPESLAHLVKRA